MEEAIGMNMADSIQKLGQNALNDPFGDWTVLILLDELIEVLIHGLHYYVKSTVVFVNEEIENLEQILV